MSEEWILEVDAVTKRFGEVTAVDDVSFTLPKGQIAGFLGPNGAGKTTTIRMILEILQPTEGRISVFGRESALAARRRIGYLPEEKGLYKKMKAWSIIAYFASLKGLDRRAARRRALELLQRYGLGDYAHERTEALSKGMGQKVQVLAAIAHDPEFVILDEPFSGLDPVNQQVMEEVIRDMAARGRTVLFSTHVMQHAERICDRLLLIDEGRKKLDGTLADARRVIPPRLELETEDDITPLRRVPGVIDLQVLGQPVGTGGDSSGVTRWNVRVEENTDPQTVLDACFRRGIRLRRFDHGEPSLHDVFVHIVGERASEARMR